MIIKNNFNVKDANPLTDYKKISDGRSNLDNYLNEKEKPNQIIQDIINKDNEFEEEIKEEDKLKFFK